MISAFVGNRLDEDRRAVDDRTGPSAWPTKSLQVKFMGEKGTAKCKMCQNEPETLMHILGKCEKLAQI